MSTSILIVADSYGKPSYAPRLRYLCEYLTQQQYIVEVFTEHGGELPFEHTYPIHACKLYRNRFDWMLKSILSLLFDWKNRYFSRWLIQQIQGQQYSAVLCTTFSTFPLRAARDAAQVLGVPLITDIRDLDEQVPGAQYIAHRQWWTKPIRRWYQKVNIHRRNEIIRQANMVTTISPWHVDFLRGLNRNVHLIYNGFDSKQFYAENIPTDVFRITYIGKIYEFQNLDPIRQVIQELNLPHVELNLHLPSYRYLPITEVGDEIRRSGIMLVLTNPQTKGMMTTKFFEALGCEKPVLCYPSDNGCLADAIRMTNAGIATDDMTAIKTFIIDKYNEWKQQGYTRQPVQNKDIFNRQLQAHQFEDLLRHSAHL